MSGQTGQRAGAVGGEGAASVDLLEGLLQVGPAPELEEVGPLSHRGLPQSRRAFGLRHPPGRAFAR